MSSQVFTRERIVRTAHPYGDTDVIDARAPRFNQTVVALISITAVLTGWWPLLGIMGAQLAIGLTFGRKFCLTCLAYFELVQPRFGEGEIEDARPPRFANILGAVFLLSATLAHAVGLPVVGWALGGMVALLATLAATTGLCVGCEMYRLMARVRGIGARGADHIELSDLEVTPSDDVVVQFTHPLCTDCHVTERKLRAEGHDLVSVDVSKRPDLARKYGVSVVPAAFNVGPDGRIVERLA